MRYDLSRAILRAALLAAALLVSTTGFAGQNSAPGAVDLARTGAYTVSRAHHEQKLRGGVQVVADEGTQLQVARRTAVPLRPNRPDSWCHALRMTAGHLSFAVPAGDPPPTSILVTTPHRIGIVSLGGEGEVLVGPDSTTVVARSGSLLVGKGNDWNELTAGQVRTLTRAGAGPDRGIIAKPHVAAAPSLVVAPEGGTASGSVSIAPVAGAASYELEVVRFDDHNERVVKHLSTSHTKVAIDGLRPGSYAIRARAVDATGVTSAAGRSDPVRVVAIDLPEGAVTEDGKVWLMPGQRIGLLGSRGLQLTYGASCKYFVAAPRDIGLVGGRSTVARLRATGSDQETSLLLEPRPHQAFVRVGPPGATWPSDLLEVDVTVVDSRGRPAPFAPVSKKVLVNGHEVAVDWQVHGARQRAIVEPPASSGPWQVEVVVSDRFGTIAREQHSVPATPQMALR